MKINGGVESAHVRVRSPRPACGRAVRGTDSSDSNDSSSQSRVESARNFQKCLRCKHLLRLGKIFPGQPCACGERSDCAAIRVRGALRESGPDESPSPQPSPRTRTTVRGTDSSDSNDSSSQSRVETAKNSQNRFCRKLLLRFTNIFPGQPCRTRGEGAIGQSPLRSQSNLLRQIFPQDLG
jgi:hypothetical protein